MVTSQKSFRHTLPNYVIGTSVSVAVSVFSCCTAYSSVPDSPQKIMPAKATALPFIPPSIPSKGVSEMRKLDPRLEQKVTLTIDRVCLGELLERLSAQTGVILSAEDKDGAAAQPIGVVALHDIPLADVMSGLDSLYSYKGAAWVWLRSPDPDHIGKSRYRLVRTDAARDFPAWLREQMQEQRDREVAEAIESLSWSPDKRQAAAKTNHQIAAMVIDPRCFQEMAAFAAVLDTNQRRQILHGDGAADVEIEGAPTPVRDYVNTEVAANPSLYRTPPTMIHYRLSTNGLVPYVSCLLGDKDGGQGFALTGGTQVTEEWAQDIQRLWTGSGDSRTDPAAAERPLSPPKNGQWDNLATASASAPPREFLSPGASGPSSRYRRMSTPALLRTVAHRGSFSLLARLPDDLWNGARWLPKPKRSAADWLHDLQKADNLDYKWHNGILIITSHDWIVHDADDEARRVSWALLKRLRDDQNTDSHHLLPLGDVCACARQLTPPQMDELLRQGYQSMLLVQWQQPLLAALDASPELVQQTLSNRGTAFTAFPANAAEALQQEAPPVKNGSPAARRVRLKVDDWVPPDQKDWRTKSGEPGYARAVTMQFLNQEGQVTATYQAPAYLSVTDPAYPPATGGALTSSPAGGDE